MTHFSDDRSSQEKWGNEGEIFVLSKSYFVPIYPLYQRRITDAIWMSSFKYVKIFSLRLIRVCQLYWWQCHFVLNLQEVIYQVRGQLLDLSHDMHKINIPSSFGSYSPACCLWLSWWPQAAPPVQWGKWDYSAFKKELEDEAVHKDCGRADGFLEDKCQM